MSDYTPDTRYVFLRYDAWRRYEKRTGPFCNDPYDEGEFYRWLARAKAEAVREFARSIDLEDIANEWSSMAVNDNEMDTAHWAAGNAASRVQMNAFDRADYIEQEKTA